MVCRPQWWEGHDRQHTTRSIAEWLQGSSRVSHAIWKGLGAVVIVPTAADSEDCCTERLLYLLASDTAMLSFLLCCLSCRTHYISGCDGTPGWDKALRTLTFVECKTS